jgi:hypothetical protein
VSNDDQIEREIQDKGLTAARVTPADIEAAIKAEYYHVIPGTTTTVCALTLDNGMVVIGHSACVSPANFDAELGQKVARSKAVDEVWALLGMRLRDRIAFAH